MKILITILSAVITVITYSQDYSYKQFTTADGLSSNVVYNVSQDSKGYMWFCTNAGVSRFDGINFRNYTIKDGMSDNEVFDAIQTPSGNILFVTFNTYPCYYSYPDGTIHNKRTDPWLQGRLPGIGSLHKDKHGVIWAQIKDDTAIYVFDEKKHLIQELPTLFKDSVIIVTDQLVDTLLSAENTAVINKINHFMNAHANIFETLPDIRAYVAFVKKYIERLSREHPSVPPHYLYDIFMTQNIPKFRFQEFSYPQVSNRTWLGHGNNGIISYADPFDEHELPEVYLSRKNINHFFIDKEGNYWFTSNGEGVFLLTAHAVRNYRFTSDTPEIHSVTGNAHCIIAGGNNEVVVLNKAGTEKFVLKLNAIAPGAIYNRVKDLLLDGNRLWVASDIGGSMFRFSSADPSSDPALPHTTTSCCESLKCLAKGADGKVYIGSHNRLMLADRQYQVKQLVAKRTTAVAEISPGNILMGSIDGLHLYVHGRLRSFGKSNLFENSITDIEKVKDSLICIATSGVGLIMLKGDKFFPISSEDSLPYNKRLSSDICRKIFVDASKNIWVCTNLGLSMIKFTSWDPPTYTIQQFTTDDGLLSNDVNDVYLSGDTVWVATMAGLNTFRYSQVKHSGSLPLTYISNIDSLHNRSFDFRTKITVGLQGISYESLGKIRYEYRLKGLNTTWQTTSTHEIYYEVLPPGSYELEVYALNRFGQKSAGPAMASFTVLPPWWQSTWAYLAYCTAFASVFLATVFLIKRNLRRKEKIRARHRKELQQLELNALRSQMNPHFIFNTLNAIQKYILENNADLSYRYLSRFSRLIRSFLENSRQTMITLQQELNLLQSYMEMEALRFRNKFTYELQIDRTLDPSAITIPSMLIQPYVENAIWHGIQHKTGNGHVKISIHPFEPGIFKCRIEDNGVGRRKAEEIEGKAYARHQPVGMTITQQRLELINQRLKEKVSVSFTDLTETDGGECGTIVELLITYSTRQYDNFKSGDHRR